MAENYSLIGETDAAIDWLEHVVDFGFLNQSFLTKHNPFLDPVRSEDRFKALMARVKKEQDAFEV